MVTSVTSMGRSGLYDWLLQRVSAVILLAWFICIGATILTTPDLGYAEWKAVFAGKAMRIFTLLALMSLFAHAWVGLWSVVTDYLTERMLGPKATVLRLLTQVGSGIVMFSYFAWVILILWGN
ncbi:MAG: succinate dehydrogenase / fumarate reductase membrane anchor subunit [Halieaceae bacterium]|jgi:succinate dehydrogenase / fumarate reductase membrane anchor subunit